MDTAEPAEGASGPRRAPRAAATPARPSGAQAPPPPRELARRVRASRTLSGTQKKYWLSVLTHLHEGDRARLDAILRGDPVAPAVTADSDSPGDTRGAVTSGDTHQPDSPHGPATTGP